MKKRMKILTKTEVDELFGPPILSLNDQRFFFTLNDAELAECKKLRDRKHRCMFILLLGSFKVKPVILNPAFHQAKKDLKLITEQILPGAGFRPFNLTQNACWRLYQRILKLANYQRWNAVLHTKVLIENLENAAHAWIEPRSLFDSAIEYLSKCKIAIPGYTVLQDLISDVVTKFNKELTEDIMQLASEGLTKVINQ